MLKVSFLYNLLRSFVQIKYLALKKSGPTSKSGINIIEKQTLQNRSGKIPVSLALIGSLI